MRKPGKLCKKYTLKKFKWTTICTCHVNAYLGNILQKYVLKRYKCIPNENTFSLTLNIYVIESNPDVVINCNYCEGHFLT